MAQIIEIRELSDPALDVYARMTQAQLRAKREAQLGICIAEGTTVIGHALEAGYEPLSFLMERKHITGKAAALLEAAGNVPVYTGESALLEQLTGFALTRGVLCALRRPAAHAPEEICAGAARVAVLEGIGDPTNVGAIFRSAAALGVGAVLLAPNCCDALHRRAIRVSMGTVFQVPWARLGGSAADWPAAGLARLRAMGFQTAALALREDSVSIEDPALAAVPRLAVLLGTEGDGLARETVAACDHTVRIPMQNGVDSLNVAAAAAVAFWQLRPAIG